MYFFIVNTNFQSTINAGNGAEYEIEFLCFWPCIFSFFLNKTYIYRNSLKMFQPFTVHNKRGQLQGWSLTCWLTKCTTFINRSALTLGAIISKYMSIDTHIYSENLVHIMSLTTAVLPPRLYGAWRWWRVTQPITTDPPEAVNIGQSLWFIIRSAWIKNA